MLGAKRLWWGAVWICVWCVVAQMHAQDKAPYSRLYVFGDSFSDTGAGYVDTNGPTAVAVLAQKLGIAFTYAGDPKATADEGLNYAVSGAQTGAGTGRHYAHGEFLSYGMRNQVDDFAAAVRAGKIRFAAAQTMFFFAGGLNDGRLPTETTVANIEGEIETLYAVGARRFMVAVLPTAVPGFRATALRLNPALEGIPAAMRAKHPDIQIATSGWGRFFDRVLAEPARYGITNTTDRCAGRVLKNEDATPCAMPDTYFYYHAEHPSAAAHRAVGAMLYDEAMGMAP